MENELSDIDKSDVHKLHAEINQLRNQQFLIAIAGLSFFGVTAAWLIPEKSTLGVSAKTLPAEFAIVMTNALLLVMGLLFFWVTRQSKLITRISTYLEVRGFSRWEIHHSSLTKISSYSSQRRTISIVFLVLGFFAFILPVLLTEWGPYEINKDGLIQEQLWWFVDVTGIFLYFVFVSYLGFKAHHDDRALAMDTWKSILTPPTGKEEA